MTKKALIIFEDDRYSNFYPLTLLRPIYFLRPGIRALYEKIIDSFDGYKAHLFCRPEIAPVAAETVGIPVNQFEDTGFEETILINGGLKNNADFFGALKRAGENAILVCEKDVIAFKVAGKLTDDLYEALKGGDLGGFMEKFRPKAQTLGIEVDLYSYLWDFVNSIDDEIRDDFEYFKSREDATGFLQGRAEMKKNGREYPGVELINLKDIYVSRDAELMPGIVLDASKGPIFIGSRARIEPHTYIAGPTYIGKETIAVGGKITGCSIGPVCRVGGEIEETIIQGYTNKYHAGFMGHSYLGEWINLGAMTTNSDLKNNYSSVKVSLNAELYDTGSLKVGLFIGDFTKTAIGTMLNTGINIGVACNITEGGLVAEREIPSFCWYSPRHKEPYNFVKALETIERTLSRREVKLTESMKRRLADIHRTSAGGTG